MTTITPNTTIVTLMQGDDMQRIVEMQDEVQRLAANAELADRVEMVSMRRLNDASPTASAAAQKSALDAAAELDEFIVAATERAFKVTLTAMPRGPWRDAREAHPARPGVKEDTDLGFNGETIGDDTVSPSVVEIVRDGKPEPNKGAELEKFLDSLSDGQWSRLVSAVIALNIDERDAPKAVVSSRLSRMFDAMQTSPEA